LDKTYLYSGPPSGVTFSGKDARQVMLHPGKRVTLPSENPYVERLVARGLLAEVAGEAPQQQAAPTRRASRSRAPKAPKVTTTSSEGGNGNSNDAPTGADEGAGS